MTSRLASPAVLFALMLPCISCDDASLAGGTSGAEAENAVALVIRNPGGALSPDVAVVARPADALTDSVWYREITDSLGRAAFRLPASRSWLLEAEADSFAALLRVPPGIASPTDTLDLARTGTIAGRLVPGTTGTRIIASGLGRSALLDSEGQFRIVGLPPGLIELRLEGSPTPWRIALQAGETVRVSLDSLAPGAFAGDPARALLFVDSLPATGSSNALLPLEFTVPQGIATPWSRTALLDDSGRILPSMLATSDSTTRQLRLWMRAPSVPPSGFLRFALDSLPSVTTSRNPFQGANTTGDPFTAYLFSHRPTGSSNDIWYSLARDTVTTCCDSVVSTQVGSGSGWSSDPAGSLGAGVSNPSGAGVFSYSSRLALGVVGDASTPLLGGISIRVRSIASGRNALVHLLDTAGTLLAQLVRSDDTLSLTTSVGSSSGSPPATSTKNVPFPSDTRWHTFALDFSRSNTVVLRVDGDSLAYQLHGIKGTNIRLFLVSGNETKLAETILWNPGQFTSTQQSLLGWRPRTRVYRPVP